MIALRKITHLTVQKPFLNSNKMMAMRKIAHLTKMRWLRR